MTKNHARSVVALTSYAAFCAAVLTSDLMRVGGPLTWPPILYAFMLVFALVHFALGFVIGRWWALTACAIPVVLTIALSGALPEDPDVPGYATVLMFGVLLGIVPIAAGFVAAGVSLRGHRDRTPRHAARGGRPPGPQGLDPPL
jgi:hypothetical protein